MHLEIRLHNLPLRPEVSATVLANINASGVVDTVRPPLYRSLLLVLKALKIQVWDERRWRNKRPSRVFATWSATAACGQAELVDEED
jgi:hypothetical protein